MTIKEAYFEDIVRILDYWSEKAADALAGDGQVSTSSKHPQHHQAVRDAIVGAALPPDILKTVVWEYLYSMTHSLLVSIDGGTKLAEYGFVSLVDDNNNAISGCLHEDFSLYLYERGYLQ